MIPDHHPKAAVDKRMPREQQDRQANLHSIPKSLVHLRDLRRDAEIDGAATDFDDQTTDEIGVDLIRLAWLADITRDKQNIPC